MRYVGVKHNNICIVSDKPIKSSGELEILEVPQELEYLSNAELIINCKIKNNQIKCKMTKKPLSELKIALVSDYAFQCGIAAYAKNLWEEIIKDIPNFKLFIEKQDQYLSDPYKIGNQNLSIDQLSICWKRGEPIHQLVKELKEYDPDIIWIQHEWGLFPNAAHWLSLMSQLSDYRVIITEHSVFNHKDKTICEAAMPEIITHLEGGKNVLINDKKISGKVYVIPHGCFQLSKEKVWNSYKSEHTIIQQGYGFNYKGFTNSLKTVAILKDKYPDIFFTALISESPFNKVGHQLYYTELVLLSEQLGIQDNIALIRGYQSETVLDSYLRTNKVALFPYISHPKHEVWGASGAARTAMTKNIPIITSDINHFKDLPTIKADNPEQMANEIDKLFSDPKLVEQQLIKQEAYLIENSWEKVAAQHLKIFLNE